ncbi:hypothetical protein LZG04_19175 [Saccharothrix sp. S26]|uniref:MSCRAMM family protein n=1 Tax=Saccharothrix sp. S26 TaxID=2907215 RepID=UPI001F18E5EB|nr:hypothetical protein [Saccharothrix sp. S26]MCE6996907.1 hypothetical protein [Saccharothrix sp. S26]
MTTSKRAVARRLLAFVAALAVTAASSAAARAQEPADAAAAAGARLAISATVGAGPFLVGALIPVEVTITNTGDAAAANVMADAHSSSGSSFGVQAHEWGDLASYPGPGATVAAGQERVLTVHGEVQQWSGAAPVATFYLRQGDAWVASFRLPIPVRDPDSGRDVLAGLVYGDRDGDGTPDAGEALAGVHVNAYTLGGPGRVDLHATTDAEGRFRFADLTVQVYSLYLTDEPDGWVVEPSWSRVVVDGSGSAANLVLRGERPLTDVLSATMRFTRDAYRVGDRAEIAVTLTNRGTTDLTGIKAGCDRSGGEGPELRDVALGELGWNASGVTVPAGTSVVVAISGSVSDEAAEHGAVAYGCDFGPREDVIDGRPVASALAKVPGPPATLRLLLFHDRDQDRTMDADEVLPGLAMDLRDAVTGQVVANGRTDAQGRVSFENVPSGPYRLRLRGAWDYPGGQSWVMYAGTCRNCQFESWVALVPGPDATRTRRVGGW